MRCFTSVYETSCVNIGMRGDVDQRTFRTQTMNVHWHMYHYLCAYVSLCAYLLWCVWAKPRLMIIICLPAHQQMLFCYFFFLPSVSSNRADAHAIYRRYAAESCQLIWNFSTHNK